MSVADPDELWPKLEKVGESEVRKRLAQGVYAQKNRPVVEEWLRCKEEDRAGVQRSAEVIHKKSELDVANSAKAAAWVAAWAAVTSIVVSVIALIVALGKN